MAIMLVLSYLTLEHLGISMSIRTQLEFIKTLESLLKVVADPKALSNLSKEADKLDKKLEELRSLTLEEKVLAKKDKQISKREKETIVTFEEAKKEKQAAEALYEQVKQTDKDLKESLKASEVLNEELKKKDIILSTKIDELDKSITLNSRINADLAKELEETAAVKEEYRLRVSKLNELV